MSDLNNKTNEKPEAIRSDSSDLLAQFTYINERGEQWFQFGSIFSIQKTDEGFEFAEECDYWHKDTVSKEKAIEVLTAAILYIKSEDFGNIPE